METSFCFIQRYVVSFAKEVSPLREKARAVLDSQRLLLDLLPLSPSCLLVQIATSALCSAAVAADLAVLEDSFIFEFASTLGEVVEVQKLPETEEIYFSSSSSSSSPFVEGHLLSRWLFTGSGCLLSKNNECVLYLPSPKVRSFSPFVRLQSQEANFLWTSHYLRFATTSLLLARKRASWSPPSLPREGVSLPLWEFPSFEGETSPFKVQQKLFQIVGEDPPSTLDAWRTLKEWESLLGEFQKKDWFALSQKVDWIRQKQILEHSLWETSALQEVGKVKPLLEKLLPYGEEAMFSPHCLLRKAGREFFQQVDEERQRLGLSWQELGELFEAYGEWRKLKKSYYVLAPPSRISCLWELVWVEENKMERDEKTIWHCLSLRKKVCHVSR